MNNPRFGRYELPLLIQNSTHDTLVSTNTDISYLPKPTILRYESSCFKDLMGVHFVPPGPPKSQVLVGMFLDYLIPEDTPHPESYYKYDYQRWYRHTARTHQKYIYIFIYIYISNDDHNDYHLLNSGSDDP